MQTAYTKMTHSSLTNIVNMTPKVYLLLIVIPSNLTLFVKIMNISLILSFQSLGVLVPILMNHEYKVFGVCLVPCL